MRDRIGRKLGNEHGKISDRRGEGTTLGNLGAVYLNLGDAYRAIRYLEQAIAVRREISDIHGVAMDSFNISILYMQQNKSSLALEYAQDAGRIFTQTGDTLKAQRAQQLITRIHNGGSPPYLNLLT